MILPRIAIIGCGQSKLPYRAPARKLYQGSLTTAARRDVEARNVPYWFASARHDLVPPYVELEPYDLSLKDLDRHARPVWGESVVARLNLLAHLRGRVVELHAGETYVDALMPALRRHGALVEVPAAGLQIGDRLAFYRDRAELRDVLPEQPEFPFEVIKVDTWTPRNERKITGPSSVGDTWDVSEVINRAAIKAATVIVKWPNPDLPVIEDGWERPHLYMTPWGLHKNPVDAEVWSLDCIGPTWKCAYRGSAPARGTIALAGAAARIGRRQPETQRLLPKVVAELLPELPAPELEQLIISAVQINVKVSGTDPMKNIRGQLTELLVPGIGRVWVREGMAQDFTMSAGERWGAHIHGPSRRRQTLVLTCPRWARPALVKAVQTLDDRPVVESARLSLTAMHDALYWACSYTDCGDLSR